MTEEIKKLKAKIKKNLDRDRYQHTLGVAYTAAALAMRYGADVNDAFTAGLLHDCAKCIPNDKKYELCKKYEIELNDTEKKAPYLLHAKLGAYLAEHEYKIHSGDIIAAVRSHTTGHENMSLLEEIIFIADYIEPNRKVIPGLDEIRALAFTDKNKTIALIAKATLEYVGKSERPLDPMTKNTYEYYRNEADK